MKKGFFTYFKFQNYFQQTAEELPNLEEFTTRRDVYNMEHVDEVVRFIETAAANSLKKFTIYCAPKFQDLIFERIQNEWEIVRYPSEYVATFLRM